MATTLRLWFGSFRFPSLIFAETKEKSFCFTFTEKLKNNIFSVIFADFTSHVCFQLRIHKVNESDLILLLHFYFQLSPSHCSPSSIFNLLDVTESPISELHLFIPRLMNKNPNLASQAQTFFTPPYIYAGATAPAVYWHLPSHSVLLNV